MRGDLNADAFAAGIGAADQKFVLGGGRRDADGVGAARFEKRLGPSWREARADGVGTLQTQQNLRLGGGVGVGGNQYGAQQQAAQNSAQQHSFTHTAG
ncbi:conserved hypothetical protein [Ricinus communis]|uniref:Uncharacterized protein n=1 Tax=Ricinus communis TaxID=3988 RepID=B9TAM9_RICCO|nr:conserved hypothetical protein [Ricinus communis]